MEGGRAQGKFSIHARVQLILFFQFDDFNALCGLYYIRPSLVEVVVLSS